MQDDIKQPESAEEQEAPAQAGKKRSKLSPYIALTGVSGVIIFALIIGLAIAFSFIVTREPAPVTYAGGFSGGSLGCYLKDNDDGFTDTATITSADQILSLLKENQAKIIKNDPQKMDLLNLMVDEATKAKVNPALLVSIWYGEQTFGMAVKNNFLGAESDDACRVDQLSQIHCMINTVKHAINKTGNYATPAGTNTWTRLLFHYTMGDAAEPDGNWSYKNKGFVTADSSARIQILQELVPNDVICNSEINAKGMLDVPGLDQNSSDWSDDPSIAASGCAYTSVAMIDRYFNPAREITPMKIKSFGKATAFITDNVNNPDFTQVKPDADGHFTTMPGDLFPIKKISDHIKQGHPILMRFRTFPVTKANGGDYKRGHYVVIVGISQDGQQIYIQDPDYSGQPKPNQNGNPPFARSSNPALYGVNESGTKFEFWATQQK